MVILAPPSSGVFAIGSKLAENLDAIYISSGEVLQNSIMKQTTAGIQCKSFVEKGQLVPDELISTLIFARLEEPYVLERGFVLEGFPRTKQQAIAMIKRGLIPNQICHLH